jgi:hypothetical protein
MVSNTLFGYKTNVNFNNFLKSSTDYFNLYLIPFIEKYYKQGDIFVHLGNMYNSKLNLNIKVIKETQDIFKKLANIIPTYLLIGEKDKINNDLYTQVVLENINNIKIINDYYKLSDDIILQSINNKEQFKEHIIISSNNFNFKFNDNIINIGSPYQLKSDMNTNNIGCYVYDTIQNKGIILSNNKSIKFLTIDINTISDLEQYDKQLFNDNYITINVTKELYENKEFIIKISEYNIKNINIIDEIVTKNEDDSINTSIDNSIIDIDEMIMNKISDDIKIKDKFNKIRDIYNR